VDVFRSAVLAGSGAQYFVGRFDGRRFEPDADGQAREVDYGMDFYAAASWANIPAGDGRHLWIAWMNSHHYASDTPTSPWRGAMSVPRALSLRRTEAGYELLQTPVAELLRLRTHHRRLRGVRVPADAEVDLGRTAGRGGEQHQCDYRAGGGFHRWRVSHLPAGAGQAAERPLSPSPGRSGCDGVIPWRPMLHRDIKASFP